MKFFLFPFLFFLAFTIKSETVESELHLKLADNSSFSIIFDNTPYNTICNSFSLSNILPGNHLLQVVAPGAGPPQLIYNGIIHIPGNVKLYTLIDLYRNLQIVNSVPVNTYLNCANGYPGNYWPFPSMPACISNEDFNYLKTAVMQEAFDSNRLELSMQAISTAYITTTQLKELMASLSFDTNRLELAKYAYLHTVDKHNYHLLHQVFDFESSIRFLKDYVRRY